MRLPRSFDRDIGLVVDTSVVINLNATGRASDILQALPCCVFVTDIVASELEEGRPFGRKDAELLARLVDDHHIKIVSMGDVGARVFGELVIGHATDTLDDGEAATIAYAVEHNIVPVIDERKANRICAQRFGQLHPASTMDLFAEPIMEAAVGREHLGDAVFQALQQARMRVLPHHVELVIRLIGSNRAILCSSLPRTARVQAKVP
jgi:predicted nucleic acid-binding protein